MNVFFKKQFKKNSAGKGQGEIGLGQKGFLRKINMNRDFEWQSLT